MIKKKGFTLKLKTFYSFEFGSCSSNRSTYLFIFRPFARGIILEYPAPPSHTENKNVVVTSKQTNKNGRRRVVCR